MELDAPEEVQTTPLTVDEDREGKRRFDPNRFFAFFPDHVTTELIVGLFLITVVTMLAVVFPAHLGPPANPAETPLHIKPEWYFFPLFPWLKLVPLWAGMAGTLLAGVALAFWPFIEGAWRVRRPRSEAAMVVGAVSLTAVLGMMIWEALS